MKISRDAEVFPIRGENNGESECSQSYIGPALVAVYFHADVRNMDKNNVKLMNNLYCEIKGAFTSPHTVTGSRTVRIM